MGTRRFAFVLVLLMVSACAGRDPYRKLPEDEKLFIEAVDIFLEEDEIEAYLKAETPEARLAKATEFEVAHKWTNLTDLERDAILRGGVEEGLRRDAVWMILGKPYRIRRQYVAELDGVEIGDYVDSFQYRYERTRKGEVFPSPPDSKTAFKNEVFEVHVDFLNGVVIRISEDGVKSGS